MPNEVIDQVHILVCCVKAEVGLTFGRQDGTEIVDEHHDETEQALEEYNSYYDPDDDKTDNYNYYGESQYYYNPKLFISGVNKNPPPQE